MLCLVTQHAHWKGRENDTNSEHISETWESAFEGFSPKELALFTSCWAGLELWEGHLVSLERKGALKGHVSQQTPHILTPRRAPSLALVILCAYLSSF